MPPKITTGNFAVLLACFASLVMLFSCSRDSGELIERVESPSSRAVAIVKVIEEDAELYWSVGIAPDWPFTWRNETVMVATECRGLTLEWLSDHILEIHLERGNVLEFSKSISLGVRRPFQRVNIRLIVDSQGGSSASISSST